MVAAATQRPHHVGRDADQIARPRGRVRRRLPADVSQVLRPGQEGKLRDRAAERDRGHRVGRFVQERDTDEEQQRVPAPAAARTESGPAPAPATGPARGRAARRLRSRGRPGDQVDPFWQQRHARAARGGRRVPAPVVDRDQRGRGMPVEARRGRRGTRAAAPADRSPGAGRHRSCRSRTRPARRGRPRRSAAARRRRAPRRDRRW